MSCVGKEAKTCEGNMSERIKYTRDLHEDIRSFLLVSLDPETYLVQLFRILG